MIISVIIPTYNHRDYVLQTLDSVFAQTFTDYEVIVINDGSPDDTNTLLRPVAEAGKIRYIEQENAGQAAARNRGLAEANGEFIAFLDDDDLWPPDKLEWQVEFLRRKSEVGVVGGVAQLFDCTTPPCETGETNDSNDMCQDVSFESLFSGSPFTSPGQTLIRAEILREVGGLDATIWGADDFDLWLRLSQVTRIEKASRRALFYRMHASNASKDSSRMLLNSAQVVHRHISAIPAPVRSAIRRRACLWLYHYAGRKVLLDAQLHLSKGHFVKVWHALTILRLFAGPALRDRKLLRWMCSDAVPTSLRVRVKKAFGHQPGVLQE